MSTNTYQILAQLAHTLGQQGLTETAQVVDTEHKRLTERYGAIETLRVVPRLPYLQELVGVLRLQEQRALAGDQYGRMDYAGALTSVIALSVLAAALNAGEQVMPAEMNSFLSKLKREIVDVFGRIENSRSLESGKARFIAEQRWQQTKRAALGEQRRQQQIGELIATKARLETALGQ